MKTIITILILSISTSLFSQEYWTKVSDLNLTDIVKVGSNDFWGIVDSALVNTDFSSKKVFYNSAILKVKDKYRKVVYNGAGRLFMLTTKGEVHSFDWKTTAWILEAKSILQMEMDDSGNLWVVEFDGIKTTKIKYKLQAKPNFSVHSVNVGNREGYRLSKGINEMILITPASTSFYILDIKGITRTIKIDTNLRITPMSSWSYKTVVYSTTKGEYQFMLVNHKYNKVKYGISKFSVSTNSWSYVGLFTEKYNLDGSFYSSSSAKKNILYFNPSSSWREQSFYLVSENGKYKFGDYNSGLGFSHYTKMIVIDKEIFVLSEYGIMKTNTQTIPTNQDYSLISNDLGASFSPSGNVFKNPIGSESQFVFNSNKEQFQKRGKLIFLSTPWFAAKNRATNGLHISAHRYEKGDKYAMLYPGPVSADYQTYSIPWISRVTKKEIDHHKKNYKNKNYFASKGIRSWPAHGFAKYGQGTCLAPFVDVDGDGMYEPEKGDYPSIRGDQAVYCIFNDDKVKRTNQFKNLGIEVHAMYYRFDNNNDNRVKNTIFMHYEIINRSNNNYDSLKIGLWNDFDLGCSQDDYVGCLPGSNSFFVYNGDSIDEDCNGVKGFGKKAPICAVTFLTDTMDGFIYHNNNQSITGEPARENEYINYLNGKWRDGSKMVYGGTGHVASGGTVPTRFMFPGKWNGQPEWTEKTARNTPGDRRGVGIIGPFTLDSKKIKTFDVMYHVVWDSINGGTIDSIPNDVTFLKQFLKSKGYKNNTYACSGAPITLSENEQEEVKELIKVFPNPNNGNFTISVPKNGEYQLRIFSMVGKEFRNETVRFEGATKRFDFSNLREGMYILDLRSDGFETTKRIVIQK